MNPCRSLPNASSGTATGTKTPPLTLPRPGFPGGDLLANVAERVLGIRACRNLYLAAKGRKPRDPKQFADFVLDEHGVTLTVEGTEHLEAASAFGKPVLVVANHPFGGIEGVAMVSLLVGLRPDAKVFANSYLGGLDGLSESFLLVEILGEGKVASHRAANGMPMRERAALPEKRRHARHVSRGRGCALRGATARSSKAPGTPTSSAWFGERVRPWCRSTSTAKTRGPGRRRGSSIRSCGPFCWRVRWRRAGTSRCVPASVGRFPLTHWSRWTRPRPSIT